MSLFSTRKALFEICLQLLPYTFWAEYQNISDCEEQPKSSVKAGGPRPGHKYERDIIRLENRSKQKRNRRKERKKNKNKSQSLKIIGINCAGLMSKINLFENLLNKENPYIFVFKRQKLKSQTN